MSKVVTKIQNAPTKPNSTLTAYIEKQDMYRQCCCCLELPCLKSLWLEYSWMGHTEIYGHMLKECFNIIWPQDEESKHQICEVCITQLRNALQFKQRIMQSHSSLIDVPRIIKSESTEIAQVDINDTGASYSNTDTLIDGDNKHLVLLENDVNNDELDTHSETIDEDSHLIKAEQLYTDISFELDNMDNSSIENVESSQKINLEKNNKIKEKKTRSAKLSAKKTIDENSKKKVKSRRKQKMTELEKKAFIESRNQDYLKPRQNLSLILENSTIIPFKSYKGYFTCFYCSKQHAAFDELKAHVSQSHENISLKLISKCIIKPQKPIKADISDITCRICKKKIDNLEDLLPHLSNEHCLKYDLNDKRKMADMILGYDFSDGKYKCYICKREFLFFKTLTSHMNSHSNSHVCDVCGQCFLLYERLKAHSAAAHVGKNDKMVKCDTCGKVCSSHLALKSHIRYKHKKILFMCFICNEKFPTYTLKVSHLKEVHNRTLDLKCKLCPKEYSTPKGLNSHMKSEHLNKPKDFKHCCSSCNMKFKSNAELISHLVVHSGERNYECEFCHKKYSRAKSLREHLKIHRNDRRWSCRACAQAFVQKCSLRNHIRVHHANMNSEELIVYKKPEPA